MASPEDHLIRVDTRRGFPIWVDLRDESFAPHVAIGLDWEPMLSDFVAASVCEGDRVTVVGACCGWYALLCDHLGAIVTAYEPGPSWQVLLRNVRDNQIRARCVPVLDSAHRVSMFVPDTDTGGWPIGRESWGCARTSAVGSDVEATTLDAEHQALDIVIVDVEGDELAVWDGARRVRKDVRVWVTEVSPRLCDAPRLLAEMLADGFTVSALHADRGQTCDPALVSTTIDRLTLVGVRS